MDDPSFSVVRMSTRENIKNLSRKVVKKLYKAWDGTRIGEQELEGRMLTDVPGALWTSALIDTNRLTQAEADKITGGQYRMIVIGWDPAVTSGEKSDEHGIVVVALGYDGHLYVLEDVSGRYTPDGAVRVVGAAYDRWQANSIVVEINNGGDWIPDFVRRSLGSSYHVRKVPAKRGKARRAEPIVAYTQQGKVRWVGPATRFATLVEQLTTWTESSTKSPDRLDGFVWACTELLKHSGGGGFSLEVL